MRKCEVPLGVIFLHVLHIFIISTGPQSSVYVIVFKAKMYLPIIHILYFSVPLNSAINKCISEIIR